MIHMACTFLAVPCTIRYTLRGLQIKRVKIGCHQGNTPLIAPGYMRLVPSGQGAATIDAL
jgi:hypothetical protein